MNPDDVRFDPRIEAMLNNTVLVSVASEILKKIHMLLVSSSKAIFVEYKLSSVISPASNRVIRLENTC